MKPGKSVGMFEAKTQFSALVEAVQRGETIIVTKNGKPVAQLCPVAARPPREFGFDRALFAAGAVKIADDFDELPPELLKAFFGE
jgi:prevent-host-death family protein